jgi:hypothetical protein
MKLRSSSPLVLSLGLVACGGSDDGVSIVVDARSVDGGLDAAAACTVSTASFGARGAVTPSLCFQDPGMDAMSASDDVIVMRAPLEAGMPFDELELDLYAGFGAFAGGFATGTFPITAEESDFATCGLCVFVNTDRDADGYVDDYLATGGSVTITSINGMLTGSVSNLTLQHVTLDESGSTPAGDGCVTAVASASFTAPIGAPPMNKAGLGRAAKARRAR